MDKNWHLMHIKEVFILMELELLGIPKQKINQLKRADIHSIEDLVMYFPRKYYDFRNLVPIRDIRDGEMCAIVGKLGEIKESKTLVYAKVTDSSGYCYAYWFNQKYLSKILKEGEEYILCGPAQIDTDFYNVRKIFPIMFDRDINKLRKIVPVYRKIKGMSDAYLQNLIADALKLVSSEDYLEENIVQRFNLISEYEAFQCIHQPQSPADIEKAKERFVFDDLFIFNFQLKNLHKDQDRTTRYPVQSCKSWTPLYHSLPFDLTDDQKKCLKFMYYTAKQGKRINALIQGDVGSGKTIVAVFMMALAAENGYQSCIMAPTEVLARQHYEELAERLKGLPFAIGYLSGNITAKQKRETLEKIKSGEIQLVVGTHAVIQDSVEFQNLGLMIVDEQHRFGVVQRETLLERYNNPHSIVMSATPIPRTLSMALYGDSIQVLTIKTKPKGRKPVITKKMTSDADVNEFMYQEIQKGRQCYVICPLIEDSESERMTDVESVNTVHKKLVKYFQKYPEVRISLISGKMKQKDIEEEIRKFANKEIDILVSTTIVEVGVNIPNASVMTVKNAERFGLAQLHQLRGRVGRSSHQSYCILQTPKEDDVKVDIMCQTNDGFEIAKKDLELRGPGDFLGVRQSGQNKYVMLMLAYPQLYEEISKLNDEIYRDPEWYAKYSFINEFELR